MIVNLFWCHKASVARKKNDVGQTILSLSEAVHLDPTMFVAYEGEDIVVYSSFFIGMHTITCIHILHHTLHCMEQLLF